MRNSVVFPGRLTEQAVELTGQRDHLDVEESVAIAVSLRDARRLEGEWFHCTRPL